MTESPIISALEQFRVERANLRARLDKVETLITDIEALFHLSPAPSKRQPPPPRRGRVKTPAQRGTAINVDLEDAIRTALRKGPLAPSAVVDKVGQARRLVHQAVQQMEARGVVVVTGATRARRIALAGTPPKEAP